MERVLKRFLLRLPLDIVDAVRGGDVHCVQVGANDGQIADPLYPYLSEKGWRGLLLEPNPVYFRRLEALHKDRPAVQTLKIGASEQASQMELHYLDEAHEHLYRANAQGCASFNRGQLVEALAKEHGDADAHIRTETVPVRPLDNILEGAGVTKTHVLVIDTEGHEIPVLAGLTLDRLKPWVAIVEVNDRVNKAPVKRYFREAGYRCFMHMREMIAVSPDFPALDIADVLKSTGMRRA